MEQKKETHSGYDRDDTGERPPVDAKFVFDATGPLMDVSLREGQNPIMRSRSGLELVVRGEPGDLLAYTIIDRRGFPLDETISISVNNATEKKTTCWECGVDENGDRHCWKIPCPVITGPWKPGKNIRLDFTLG